MMIASIAILIIAVITLLCVLFKSGKPTVTDSEYYVDGYHIYYDRKIISQLKSNQP